jgi:tetratricopeptide (TPR) repeat protein
MIHFRRIAALCAVLLLAFIFTACDKLSSKRGSGSESGAPVKKFVPSEKLFDDARIRLDAAKYAEAVEFLAKAKAQRDAPASLQDWMLLYQGLAEFLAGHDTEARSLFAELAERTDADKEAGQLAKFFHSAAEPLSAEGPVSPRVVTAFDHASYEVIALYLFALKTESAGVLNDAMTFYRHFTTAPADGPEPFRGFNAQLKKFRQSANDICEYEELVDAATRARKANADPEIVSEAADAALTARERIKRNGKLIASLDERIGEKAKAMAVEVDADTQAFPPAKVQYYELLARCEYAEARNAIFEPHLKSVKKQKEQDLLAARAGYLEKFKFYLVLEIGNTGYSQPVTLKDGKSVSGGIAKFEDKTIQLRDKTGVRTVPWSDLAPESLLAIGQSLIADGEEADKAAFRKWHLGNYAAAIGRTEEARKLMQEAVAANPQYAPEMTPLLELPAKM